MAATNLFGRGFGEKRFNALLKEYPNILIDKEADGVKAKKLESVDGFAKKTAERFVSGIDGFLQFMREAGLEKKLDSGAPSSIGHAAANEHPLFGKRIVLTGFRDKELVKRIKDVGGEQGDSVSKATFIVLVKDKDEDTGKAEQARKHNIPLMTPEEFNQKYNL